LVFGFFVLITSVMDNPFRYYFMTPDSHENSDRLQYMGRQ